MICLDTTFLVDLWRGAGNDRHPALQYLRAHAAETFAVPAHAAGDFLEGGAAISAERYAESLHFVRRFLVGSVTLETAQHYARIVAELRREGNLTGISKPDVWIAAWAVEHSAVLATRNVKHFEAMPGLSIDTYA